MIVKDKKGKYEMKVDTAKKVVYEKNMGLWQKEDMIRQREDYKKVFQELKKSGIKSWGKICDLREYKMSNIAEDVNEISQWFKENGQTHCAFVQPKSVIVKMQMNRVVKDIFVMAHFDNLEDAEKWLAKEGY
jgi:hypothetical protein